ncbi:UNVERIFIED_CONTAM: hypothetical protein FKN15_031008 [Acipenser sinensis]
MDRGNQSFDVWKDYFGLAELLQETRTRGAAGSEPGPEPSPLAATQPDRGTKQQSASEVKTPSLNQPDPTDEANSACFAKGTRSPERSTTATALRTVT